VRLGASVGREREERVVNLKGRMNKDRKGKKKKDQDVVGLQLQTGHSDKFPAFGNRGRLESGLRWWLSDLMRQDHLPPVGRAGTVA
jgi:hypothetical protein